MRQAVFVRGTRLERPLPPARLKAGRSLLRTVAGLALVSVVGVTGFTVGYPTGAGPSSQQSDGPATGSSDNRQALSDRTRPDWLAKLASAPPTSQSDDSGQGLETAALAERIEAAASVTGSIAPPKKAARMAPNVPLASAPPAKPAPKAQVAEAKVSPPAPKVARQEPTEKPAATKPAPPRERKQVVAAADSASSPTLAGYLRRPGLTRAAPPPDPAR